mmetsp:Transcript_27345/g.70261  ORF Transcript_27345/g.70261 Transcript_27345/m.70261 type:complete len:295 (+) Transcript_27345:493-1377(+)
MELVRALMHGLGVQTKEALLVARPVGVHAAEQRLRQLDVVVDNEHRLGEHLTGDAEAVVHAVGGKGLQDELGGEGLQVKRRRCAVEHQHDVAHDGHGVVCGDVGAQVGGAQRPRVRGQHHREAARLWRRWRDSGQPWQRRPLAPDEVDPLILEAAQLGRVPRVIHRVKQPREAVGEAGLQADGVQLKLALVIRHALVRVPQAVMPHKQAARAQHVIHLLKGRECVQNVLNDVDHDDGVEGVREVRDLLGREGQYRVLAHSRRGEQPCLERRAAHVCHVVEGPRVQQGERLGCVP